MPFAPTDEQRMLVDSVARFIERDYSFERRRALVDSETGFGADNWARFADLGWLGVPFPEKAGGYGGSLVDAALVMEELGRGLAVEPYLWTVVLGGGLLQLAEADDHIPALVAGDLQLAFGYAEPRGRYALTHVETRADSAGLTGHKAVVFNAVAADFLIVSAREEGAVDDPSGISLYLVARDAPGMTLRSYPTVDGLRAAEVLLDGVSPDRRLGPRGAAAPLIEAAIDRATAAVCCEASGIMQAMVAATGDYLKTRKQFGQPLAAFQVLQHRMADLFVIQEQARSMAHMAAVKAASVADADPVDRARSVSAAKAYIGHNGRFLGQEAIQMHGGMGVTDEMPISHYFKRLTMIDTLFGNAGHHRRRFADLMDAPAA